LIGLIPFIVRLRVSGSAQAGHLQTVTIRNDQRGHDELDGYQ
jgi:hypothetical protein